MTPLSEPKKDFYNDISLTEQEEKDALLEGKIAKYFREKHAPYWEESEKKKVGQTLDEKVKNGKL
jgi:hypothetical protein